MGRIKVLNPGLLTMVQDKGRYGYQQFGVPVSGVMDSYAHRLANILVENDEYEGVLEITMLGPHIEFENDEIIAVTGGDLTPMINGSPIPMWKSIHVKPGDLLTFGTVKNGCRSYIAFAGGIDVPLVMGSKSTYIKGRIGGFKGRALKAQDILKIKKPEKDYHKIKGRKIPQEYIPKYFNTWEVNVILGPQDDYFTKEGIQTFLNNEYIVTNECDRMGYRLNGVKIEHINSGDIISDGISFGAIQVPGQGQPIIMMADRQTTGGYTKIANVISTDLYKIAQAKPGDKIKFKEITIEEAHRLLKELEQRIIDIKSKCAQTEIISVREFCLRINGNSYQVKVEEIK